MKILRFFGSLLFAVVLLAVLAVVLAMTTFVESVYGDAVTQYFVYQSRWFYALLTLLGLNVLCSMLARLPWRKSQLPFLTAHIGILVLLLGCLVTAKWKQEANLTLIEGKSARFAVAKGHHFALTPISLAESETETEEESPQEYAQRLENERNATISFPFDGGPFDWQDYKSQNRSEETPQKYRRLLGMLMFLNPPQKKTNSQRSLTLPALNNSLEVLDYFANSAKDPAGPLKMSVQWGREKEDCELYITPQVGSYRGSKLELGLGATHTFQDGERITFRVAESQAEVDAFLESEPSSITSGLGTIVLIHRGKKYEIPLDSALQKSVPLRPQMDALREQMADLMRQRRVARTEEKATEENIREIEAKISQTVKEIETLRKESFYSVDGSNYVFEFSQFNPNGLDLEDKKSEPQPLGSGEPTTGPMVHVTIHAPNGDTDAMLLFAERPDMNSQANKFGFYATYCFSPEVAKEKEANFFSEDVVQTAKKPRLDLMQTPQGKIVYRFWADSQFVGNGEWGVDSGEWIVGSKKLVDSKNSENGQNQTLPTTHYPLPTISDIEFEPHDLPGYTIVSIPFEKDRDYVPQQRAKVRVTLDGTTEEFWILAQFSQQEPYRIPLDEEQVRWLPGKDDANLVRFTYARNEVDLGFSLYLRKFTQKMEPGTQTASQFSSLVEMRAPEEIADRLDLVRESGQWTVDSKNSENGQNQKLPTTHYPLPTILIKMNQPGIFRDKFTGRKYRVYQSSRQGPFGPEKWEFRQLYDKSILPGETVPREWIFMSILSVNHDPGRGLKYLGSAMLIFGTAWLFYGKRKR